MWRTATSSIASVMPMMIAKCQSLCRMGQTLAAPVSDEKLPPGLWAQGVLDQGSGSSVGPQRLVGRQEPRHLVAPLELVQHAPAAVLAHLRAPLRIVEQLADLGGEVPGVVLL